MTKAMEAYACMQRLRALHSEVCSEQQRLADLRREMGHPTDEIERAVEMKKTIVRGCTQNP